MAALTTYLVQVIPKGKILLLQSRSSKSHGFANINICRSHLFIKDKEISVIICSGSLIVLRYKNSASGVIC